MTFEEFKSKMISRMKGRSFFQEEAKENNISTELYCSIYFDYMNTVDNDVQKAYKDVCEGESINSVTEPLLLLWSYWETIPLPEEVLKKYL